MTNNSIQGINGIPPLLATDISFNPSNIIKAQTFFHSDQIILNHILILPMLIRPASIQKSPVNGLLLLLCLQKLLDNRLTFRRLNPVKAKMIFHVGCHGFSLISIRLLLKKSLNSLVFRHVKTSQRHLGFFGKHGLRWSFHQRKDVKAQSPQLEQHGLTLET